MVLALIYILYKVLLTGWAASLFLYFVLLTPEKKNDIATSPLIIHAANDKKAKMTMLLGNIKIRIMIHHYRISVDAKDCNYL